MEICKGCGRNVADSAACLSCPTEPLEHRGSRMPEILKEIAIDPLFASAIDEFSPDERVLLEKAAG